MPRIRESQGRSYILHRYIWLRNSSRWLVFPTLQHTSHCLGWKRYCSFMKRWCVQIRRGEYCHTFEFSWLFVPQVFSGSHQTLKQMQVAFKLESADFVQAAIQSDIICQVEYIMHIVNYKPFSTETLRLPYKVLQQFSREINVGDRLCGTKWIDIPTLRQRKCWYRSSLKTPLRTNFSKYNKNRRYSVAFQYIMSHKVLGFLENKSEI